MIEPIKPEPSDVNALLQLTQRPGRIREVHLFPVPKATPPKATSRQTSRQASLPVLPTSRPDQPLPDNPA
jgi:hypothetical protein